MATANRRAYRRTTAGLPRWTPIPPAWTRENPKPKHNPRPITRRPSGNPAVTFTPSPAFASADWDKAVSL